MTKNLNSFLLTISALFCFVTAKAQSFPDTAWMKLYGGTQYDGGTDIHQTFDGGYIVLARAESNDGDLINAPAGIKQWILKIDSLGNFEWEEHYVVSAHSRSIIQTRDSGYVFGMPFVTKLNNDGSLSWQATFSADHVIQTYEGGYASLRGTTITKFDSLADIEWEFQSMPSGVLGDISTYDLRQTPDSGIVFCGRWHEDWWNNGWWIVKMDKDGVETLNIHSNGIQYSCIEVGKDGNLLLASLAGHYQKTGPPQIWSQDIDSISLRDIMENIDSTIVMCGSDPVILSDTLIDAYMIKTTHDGDTITSVMIGGNRGDFLNKVNPTKDNGYIAVGSTKSHDGNFSGNHGNSDLWIVKYKQDTSIHTPQAPVMVKDNRRKNEVTVYPTLNKGVVHVQFPEGYDDAVVEVYNITGQRVPVKISGGESKRVVALGNQPIGQYILQVRNDGERKVFRVTLMP